MKSWLKIWLLLMLCASAAAENYQLVGLARMAGFDVLAKKLTILTQQVAPEAKALPAVMFAAMAFNPNLAPFDLTDPILVAYYRAEKNTGGVPLWCVVVSLSDGVKAPDRINLFGHQAKLRVIGNKVIISWSKELLDSLNEPPKERDTEHDFALWFAAAEYSRSLPAEIATVRNFLLGEVVKPAAGAEKTGNDNLRVRMEYLEKLLAQAREADVTLDLVGAGAVIAARLVPVKNSALAAFVARQQSHTAPLPPVPDRQAATIVVSVNPDPATAAAAADLLNALSGWNDSRHQSQTAFVRALIDNCDGRAAVYADPAPQGGEQLRAEVYLIPSRQPKIAAALAAFPAVAAAPGMRELSQAGARYRLFAVTSADRVDFAGGNLTPPQAVKLLQPAVAKPKRQEPVDPGTVFFGCWTSGGADAMTVSGSCADGALTINGKLDAPMMRLIFPRLAGRIGQAAGINKR